MTTMAVATTSIANPPAKRAITVTIDRIDELVRNGFCTGCGLCESIAGSERSEMRVSTSGYLRPGLRNNCSAQTRRDIPSACPAAFLEHPNTASNHHPIWGPLENVRTGHATDNEIRREGSSGGVLSALALHLIETGKVDFVAQIAASPTSPLVNELQLSCSRADVLRAAGSRYAPSAPLAHLEELLATGKRFALIGKPCDVAAVRHLGRQDPRIANQVRYLLSFMCAGIPSIYGTHELLERLGIAPDEVKTFRYRGDGWPGKARATTADGRVAEMDYNTSWGTILNRHLQFRCKICPDGTGEFADVVCADAWYGQDGYPDFQEREGRSLVLTRTSIGEALVLEAISANVIAAADLAVEEIAAMQPYQVNRKKMLVARLVGTLLRRGRIPRFRRMGLLRASLSVSPVAWLRECWGTFKRANGESL